MGSGDKRVVVAFLSEGSFSWLEAGTYVLITTDNPINPLSVGTFLLAETEDGMVSYRTYNTLNDK